MKHDCAATRKPLQIKPACPRVATVGQSWLRTLTLLAWVIVLLSAVGAQAADQTGMRVVAGDGTAGFEDGFAAQYRKPIRLAPWGEDSVLVAVLTHGSRIWIADLDNHRITIIPLAGPDGSD